MSFELDSLGAVAMAILTYLPFAAALLLMSVGATALAVGQPRRRAWSYLAIGLAVLITHGALLSRGWFGSGPL